MLKSRSKKGWSWSDEGAVTQRLERYSDVRIRQTDGPSFQAGLKSLLGQSRGGFDKIFLAPVGLLFPSLGMTILAPCRWPKPG